MPTPSRRPFSHNNFRARYQTRHNDLGFVSLHYGIGNRKMSIPDPYPYKGCIAEPEPRQSDSPQGGWQHPINRLCNHIIGEKFKFCIPNTVRKCTYIPEKKSGLPGRWLAWTMTRTEGMMGIRYTYRLAEV
jgi:hypothetical protein